MIIIRNLTENYRYCFLIPNCNQNITILFDCGEVAKQECYKPGGKATNLLSSIFVLIAKLISLKVQLCCLCPIGRLVNSFSGSSLQNHKRFWWSFSCLYEKQLMVKKLLLAVIASLRSRRGNLQTINIEIATSELKLFLAMTGVKFISNNLPLPE